MRRGIIDKNDLQYIKKRFGEPSWSEPAPIQGKILNVFSSRFHYRNGKIINGKYVTYIDVFHVKPVYYKHVNGEFRPLYEIASYYGNKNGMVLKQGWENVVDFGYLAWYIKRQELMKGKGVSFEVPYFGKFFTKIPVYLAITSPFYPDPDVEVNSVDGQANRGNVNEIFSTIRGGAGNGSQDTGAALVTRLFTTATTDQFDQLLRGFFLFYTGPTIPDADPIASSIFSLWVTSRFDSAGGAASANSAMVLVASTPASNTAIVNADYSQVGTTEFGRSAKQADLTDGAYNDITLNASGIAAIVKTDSPGVSKFGIRYGWDFDNTLTGFTWASAVRDDISISYAETATTAQDPKLAVVHGTEINVNESVTVAETVTVLLTNFINVNDPISVTESVVLTVAYSISVFDSANVAESIAMSLDDFLSVNEPITISESISIFLNPLLLSVNDAVTVSENVAMALASFISVDDSITVSESISATLAVNVNVNDTATITESVEMSLTDFISKNEAITVAESITAIVEAQRSGLIHLRSDQQDYPLAMDDETTL